MAKKASCPAYIYKAVKSLVTQHQSEPRNELYSTQIKQWPPVAPNIDTFCRFWARDV